MLFAPIGGNGNVFIDRDNCTRLFCFVIDEPIYKDFAFAVKAVVGETVLASRLELDTIGVAHSVGQRYRVIYDLFPLGFEHHVRVAVIGFAGLIYFARIVACDRPTD